jgi:hypothetical protein
LPYTESGKTPVPVVGEWGGLFYALLAPLGLVEGDTYIVTWVGKEYTCIAKKVNAVPDGSITGIALGNVAEGGSEQTDEPFAILEAPMGDAYGMITTADGSEREGVVPTIHHVTETIHKLPGKFLPDGLPYTEDGLVEILPETTLEPIDGTFMITTPPAEALVVGNRYTVFWNGEEYPATAMDGAALEAPAPFLVNDGADLSTFEGVVFLILLSGSPLDAFGGAYGAIDCMVEGALTLAIYHNSEIIHPLDGKYLPEGVPYSEGGVVEILPETEVMASGDGSEALVSNNVVLEVGKTYLINYNGVEYTCITQDLSAIFQGAVGVGNLAMMELPDTGEPFAMVYDPTMGIVLMDYAVAESGVDTLVTVAIYHNGEVIHKLDNKFIDAEWMATNKEVKGEELIAERKYLMTVTIINNVNTAGLAEGGKVLVICDGVEYECPLKRVVVDGEAGLIAGNLGAANGLGWDNGEPFMLAIAGNEITVIVATTGSVLSVYAIEKVPDKLPEKFMPYLTSPNGTKYQLTVADDGTLSATPVG